MSRRAFVIGDPIAHSKSPLIHTAWLAENGIAGTYEAVHVAPEALPAFIERVRAGEFAGGNVTLPHKQAVLALCDIVDPAAEKIGAVNTLVADEGIISGSNTDAPGFTANLDDAVPGWDARTRTAVVLGAGGAARAILAALEARGVETIHLLNRSPDRARDLATRFGPAVTPGTLDAFSALAERADLLVNTTTIGMGGTRFEGLDLDALPAHAVVADIVYTPLMTPLLTDARARGLHIVDGLGMLLHQAVPGFAAWFGVTPRVTPALRQNVIEALGL